MTTTSRQPKGTPVGGQFAESAKAAPEAAAQLTEPRIASPAEQRVDELLRERAALDRRIADDSTAGLCELVLRNFPAARQLELRDGNADSPRAAADVHGPGGTYLGALSETDDAATAARLLGLLPDDPDHLVEQGWARREESNQRVLLNVLAANAAGGRGKAAQVEAEIAKVVLSRVPDARTIEIGAEDVGYGPTWSEAHLWVRDSEDEIHHLDLSDETSAAFEDAMCDLLDVAGSPTGRSFYRFEIGQASSGARLT